ncbi:MAG: DNA polymerase III subunit gamma/tau [Bacteroidota bacterium]
MSDQYLVSARKYRPNTFETVVGQSHITTTLKNAIKQNHLAHAYLFCGPRGVGKSSCARILAKTINCENITGDTEACGTCETCKSFSTNSSFNIFELDAASNNSVEDIRNLTDQVRFAPQSGKYKIYIIDEVHMLSTAAFNAFLKTLEEPPAYAIFILATTEKHKILPTILSRCQIFDFKRITTHDIVDHLQQIAVSEHIQADTAALHVIAQKSEGCMRDALSMIDRIASFTNAHLSYASTMEHLNLLDADFYFQITDKLLSQDVSNTLLSLDAILEKGFEGEVILEGLAEHFRNLLICKDARMAKLLDVPNDHKAIYYEKANQMPPSFILSAMNLINDAIVQYKQTSNKRLHLEMTCIKLCYLLQTTPAGVEKKNKLTDTAFSAPSIHAETAPVPSSNVVEKETTISNTSIEPIIVVEKEPLKHTMAEEPKSVIEETVVNIIAAENTTDRKGIFGQNKNAKKVSLNVLSQLETQLSNPIVEEETTLAPITEEEGKAAFEQYKQSIAADNQNQTLFQQLLIMELQVLPPDELHLVCPIELNEEYAKNQRGQMIQFMQELLKRPVRVTTSYKPNPELLAKQPKALSKQELFDKMSEKNPDLQLFKDTLGLQIEY